MTAKEFAILVKTMKAVYADPKFMPDDDAKEVWFEMLRDLPYEAASEALKRYMCSGRFPPTIADIRSKAAQMQESATGADMGGPEAWALAYKATCNSGYNSEEEFAKLPRVIQKAVGRPENLKEWAQMDLETVNSVIMSQFIRAYNAVLAQEREFAKLPPDARGRISMHQAQGPARISDNIMQVYQQAQQEKDRTTEPWGEKAQQKYEELLREFGEAK